MISQQIDFSGGLDLISSDVNIALDSYHILVNARQRYGNIEPIQKHVKIANTPPGILQGCIGVGNVLIIFVAGRAYTQQDGSTDWNIVPGFNMDTIVSQYYIQTVPASNLQFLRKQGASVNAEIILTTDFKVSGTQAGIVVQDGINQPNIIYFDEINLIFVGRPLGTFDSWTNKSSFINDREYVPIGKQMMFLSGILFIVATNGKSIFRSITGRPLDFMVNVDTNGNKASTESIGGASSVSFAFDFDAITHISPVNVPDSFVCGTAHNIRIINLDFTKTIFGEPTFSVAAPFEAGIVNQYSKVDINGDYAFIDFDSIKTFNAAQTIKFRARNSIFSVNIARALFGANTKRPIRQQIPFCFTYNNYAIFNVDTRYGNLMLIYDSLLNKWVSMDSTYVARIKQVAFVEIPTQTKLYAITQLNELFQLFTDGTAETSILKTKAFTYHDKQTYMQTESAFEHKGQFLKVMFDGGTYNGNVVLFEYVDDQESMTNRETKPLNVQLGGVVFPVQPPIIPSTKQKVNEVTFSLSSGLTGRKLSYVILWTNDSKLINYEIISDDHGSQVAQKQKDSTFNSQLQQSTL